MKRTLLIVIAVMTLALLLIVMDNRGGGPEKMERAIRTNPESIDRGERLFNADCRYCHDPFSTRMKTGPGLLGILRKPRLPASGRAATPENIRKQLTHPYDRMPSFSYLTKEEQEDLLAFLSTL